MSETPFAATTVPADVYRNRRRALATRLSRPLAVFAGHAPARNYASNPHEFRAGSTYLYFGGPPIEHAVLLIEPDSDGNAGCTLLRPPPGPDDALWMGEAPTDADLAATAGLEVRRIADADALASLLAGRETPAVAPPCVETIERVRTLGLAPPSDDELRAIIDLRLVKDKHELAAMRRSATVCMEAHRAALAATRPGVREADVMAAFMHVLHKHECRVSFSPIITVRGEVLHACGHHNLMREGQLLLCDAGAEEPGGYASDITRTWPVGGTWSQMQLDLYETVRRALDDAVEACRAGVRYRDVHDLAALRICEGLVEVGLLRGEPTSLRERTAHALFFPHGVGHLIGLDVHDMEDFGDLAGYAPGRSRRTEFGNRFLRLDRDLQAGMCVTIEPGIYFVPAVWRCSALVDPVKDAVNQPLVDELLAQRFGGIRIEHTICVREAGSPEVLSAALPTAPDELTSAQSFEG